MAGGSQGKELRELIAELRVQGFTVDEARSHPMVWCGALCPLDPIGGGHFVTTLARTPSERRGWQNCLSRCRRHGFAWKGR